MEFCWCEVNLQSGKELPDQTKKKTCLCTRTHAEDILPSPDKKGQSPMLRPDREGQSPTLAMKDKNWWDSRRVQNRGEREEWSLSREGDTVEMPKGVPWGREHSTPCSPELGPHIHEQKLQKHPNR